MFRPKDISELEIGSYIGDAHYGVPEVMDHTWTLTRASIRSHDIVRRMVGKRIMNKGVYVISEETACVVAAYSYDDHTLGLISYYWNPTDAVHKSEENTSALASASTERRKT